MRRAGPDRPRAGIVLAHGRGGSAQDMLGLIRAAGVPDLAVLAPEAPGNSWWPTSFLAPSAGLEPFVLRGLSAMTEAVALFEADGLPRDRIWLGGFSQGACLALETFARAGDGLAGVFGFSGGLAGTADAGGGPSPDLYGHADKQFDYAGKRLGQVWLSAHARDPHIPLARVQRSAGVLEALGAGVTTTIWPGAGHSLMPADLEAMRSWTADPA